MALESGVVVIFTNHQATENAIQLELRLFRAETMNTMPFQKTLKNQQVSWFYVTFGMTQLAFSTFFSETKMPELAELTQAY